jgi:hypothetical protein
MTWPIWPRIAPILVLNLLAMEMRASPVTLTYVDISRYGKLAAEVRITYRKRDESLWV